MDLFPYAPRADGKYSPNFHRWAKRFLREHSYVKQLQVFLPSHDSIMGNPQTFVEGMSANTMLIGFAEASCGGEPDSDWFTGARIAQILTTPFPKERDGVYMNVYAHPHVAKTGQDVTDWFWQAYLERGRCVFDPSHDGWMKGDEHRFVQVNVQHRKCAWCGAVQLAEHREQVVMEKVWKNVA